MCVSVCVCVCEKEREREREREGERGRQTGAISSIYLTLILPDIIIFWGASSLFPSSSSSSLHFDLKLLFPLDSTLSDPPLIAWDDRHPHLSLLFIF